MRKLAYESPKVGSNQMKYGMAAPLAFFSAATAAAAVVGTAVGAAAASKVLGDDFDRRKININYEIKGLCK